MVYYFYLVYAQLEGFSEPMWRLMSPFKPTERLEAEKKVKNRIGLLWCFPKFLDEVNI